MRKNIVSIIFVFALVFLSGNVWAASSATVQKTLENSNLNVGDTAVIALEIRNPFNQPLPVRIADKNIFANNGIDVQCVEYNIPALAKARLAYDPIELFASGKYMLDAAKVTYTNPETQKEDTVSSNTLDVNIGGTSSGAQQAITTIYRCNGQSMTSTSYSSSGSSQSQQSPDNNQNSQQQQKQENAADKVQNNQMPQDADAIRQQMQEQATQQKKMQDEFAKQVAQNQEVQKMNKELADKGFSQKSQSVSAETNNTGNFEMNYTKPNGETAKIAGRMENGEMKDLYSQNSEDEKNIMQMLRNNSEYQKYENALKKDGLSQMQPQIQKRNDTYSITVPFNAEANISTKIEAVEPNMTNIMANITAIVANNTVKEVKLQENSKKELWYLWLIPIIAAAYFIYKKYLQKPPVLPPEEIIAAPKISYKKQAKAMLEQAKKLFSDGAEKEAYALVSEAVRFYFKEKLALQKELASTELVRHLKHAKYKYSDVQKCLNMCGLVEFAKYVPNREDFEEIMGLAEGEIV